MLLPLCVMIFFAKEPPDIEHQCFSQHLSCLWEKDGWAFNLIYIITFGGFLGLATFLPSFYLLPVPRDQNPGRSLTVLATLTGCAHTGLGGWFADRIGGITTLSVVFLIAIAGLFGLMTTPPRSQPRCSSCFASPRSEQVTERPSSSSRCAGRSPPRSPAA